MQKSTLDYTYLQVCCPVANVCILTSMIFTNTVCSVGPWICLHAFLECRRCKEHSKLVGMDGKLQAPCPSQYEESIQYISRLCYLESSATWKLTSWHMMHNTANSKSANGNLHGVQGTSYAGCNIASKPAHCLNDVPRCQLT